MKKTFFALAVLLGVLGNSFCFLETENSTVYAAENKADHTKADLKKMGLTGFFGSGTGIGSPPTLKAFLKNIMAFLGRVIIFVSVGGFMVGGGFWVFSAGDGGLTSRGKSIMIASIIGLSVTLLSVVIIKLVEYLIYNIGE